MDHTQLISCLNTNDSLPLMSTKGAEVHTRDFIYFGLDVNLFSWLCFFSSYLLFVSVGDSIFHKYFSKSAIFERYKVILLIKLTDTWIAHVYNQNMHYMAILDIKIKLLTQTQIKSFKKN